MAKSICDFIREHNGGATHDEYSSALADVVAAVTDEQKGGTLTFVIAIKPLGKGNGLQVSTEIKAKPPKQTVGVQVFFATPDNSLQREDPRQKKLDLREIPPGSAHLGVA